VVRRVSTYHGDFHFRSIAQALRRTIHLLLPQRGGVCGIVKGSGPRTSQAALASRPGVEHISNGVDRRPIEGKPTLGSARLGVAMVRHGCRGWKGAGPG
jgi:hypothetical protein